MVDNYYFYFCFYQCAQDRPEPCLRSCSKATKSGGSMDLVLKGGLDSRCSANKDS